MVMWLSLLDNIQHGGTCESGTLFIPTVEAVMVVLTLGSKLDTGDCVYWTILLTYLTCSTMIL